MKNLSVLLFLVFLSISAAAQDFSAFYGVWRGFTKMEDGSIDKNKQLQITFFGVDTQKKILVGEVEVFSMPGFKSDAKQEMRLEVSQLGTDPSKISFPSITYNSASKEIKITAFFELQEVEGKKILLSYASPINPAESIPKTTWVLAYVGLAPKREGIESTPKLILRTLPVVVTNKPSASPATELTEGAALLFKDVKSNLSIRDKNFIQANTALMIAPDKKRFIMRGSTNSYASDVQVIITDLNDDKIEEVFIYFKSPSITGVLEEGVSFFAKNKGSDDYLSDFGTTRPKPQIVPRYSYGYPDLFFDDSRAFPAAVYIWDGKHYVQQLEKINKKALAQTKTLPVEAIGKAHQEQGYQAARDLQMSIGKIYNQPYFNMELPVEKAPKVYGKKGSPAKFIGRYWQIGYYDRPFTLSKVGNNFYLKSSVKGQKIMPAFTYNVKNDWLECWVEGEGLKFKMLITYNYKNGSIYLEPENKRLGGMFPTHLVPYD